MLVDPTDAPEITSEIPESPIFSGQSSSYEYLKDPEQRFSLPPGLEVRLTRTQGRGIWNQSQRRKGEILLGEVPTVATLSTRYLATHCSACFFESGDKPLKRCPACQLIHYCDPECQARDWPLHKRECPALQKWLAAAPQASPALSDNSAPGMLIPSDAIRVLGRLLWRRQKKGRDSIWVKETDAMQSHRASLSSNEQTSQLYTHMAHALVRYLGLESLNELAVYGIDSIAALVDLVSRFTTNAFAVTSPTLTPIGVCVSPKVALFNHSCEPNAVLVFPGVPQSPKKDQPKLVVITIKNIPPDEEISISYIDTTLPRYQRQEALKQTYYFTCNCPLCSTTREGGTDVDLREGIYCSRKCGGVCWLPTEEDCFTRCTKCKAVVRDTDAVLDAVRIGQEALEKATRVQFSDPQKAIQLTQNLIPILTSAGLLLSSHPLLALSRLHTTLLITNFRSPFDSDSIELNSPQIQEQRQLSPETKSSLDEAQESLDEAIRSATRTCNGLNQILPYGHPIRGLAVAELGKLLSVDEPAPKHLIDGAVPSPSSPPTTATTSQLASAIPAPYPPSGPQRLKLAYETLVRAKEELMVGFGGGKNEGGQVGLEARKLLVDIEKELGVWREGIRSAIADLPKTTGGR
ncbi:SET domain-containing protein [Macrolepiota fuliginosa MF-IS2]|uniref:SET domain-containing protein n=1 Tax=Macrolepiota fuliginosa MF-IS2 TaxID=1400762 RepID=A0A9P6BXK2_9AGAR|nr:SET domain-containing protein [Macrolepiota fuliginosa MF-IS2]